MVGYKQWLSYLLLRETLVIVATLLGWSLILASIRLLLWVLRVLLVLALALIILALLLAVVVIAAALRGASVVSGHVYVVISQEKEKISVLRANRGLYSFP